MSLRKVRLRRDGGFKSCERLNRPVEAAQRMAAIGQDLRMTGHFRQRGVIARDGFNGPVESQQRVAAIDPRADMIGVFRQHRIEMCERVIDTAKLKIGIGKIVENFRMIRRKLQRVAIACDRLFPSPDRVQRQSKIGHRIGGGGIDPQRLRQKAKRLGQAMTLEIEHAQQMQRVEIVRPVFKNTRAQFRGAIEVALLKRAVSLPLQA